MTDTTGDIGPSISPGAIAARTISAGAIGHGPVMALSGGTALSDAIPMPRDTHRCEMQDAELAPAMANG